MDMTRISWRWYPGDEAQSPDPFILAKMGPENTPAYRGTAYVVFEELDLTGFGNRLPQLTFEMFRPLADADTAEGLVRAVTLIPASGEFSYATEVITKATDAYGSTTSVENLNGVPEPPTSWWRWTGCNRWHPRWRASRWWWPGSVMICAPGAASFSPVSKCRTR